MQHIKNNKKANSIIKELNHITYSTRILLGINFAR